MTRFCLKLVLLISLFDIFIDLRYKICQRHRTGIIAVAQAQCDLAVLGLSVADHEHVGRLLPLRLADLVAKLFVAPWVVAP